MRPMRWTIHLTSRSARRSAPAGGAAAAEWFGRVPPAA
jgi:hypothetical protein